MKRLIFWNETLYLLNAALLIAHEIDSAYWQEWNLFGIPGGIQVFVVINLLLVIAVLLGYRSLIHRHKGGLIMSLLLSAAGLFAFTIHTLFLVRGRPEFNLPVSLGLLGMILLVSLAQAVVAGYTFRPFERPPTILQSKNNPRS